MTTPHATTMRKPYLLFDEFLGPASYRQLLRDAADSQRWFHPSRVVSADGGNVVDARVRRSAVLDDVGTETAILAANLLTVAPALQAELGVAPFAVVRVEMQITATGDGGFFARHGDNGAAKNRTRALSFVYFANEEPKRFAGGELLIHAPGGPQTIAPAANTLVVFRPEDAHEIAPVRLASARFSSQRITANGWLHCAPPRLQGVDGGAGEGNRTPV